MATRIDRLFGLVRAHAAARMPMLGSVRSAICPVADRDHAREWRLFAHTNHRPMTVCWARAAEQDLTDLEALGMSAHEFGHIVGESLRLPRHASSKRAGRTPLAVQDEADKVALEMFGLAIRYNGRKLQELANPQAVIATAPHTGPAWERSAATARRKPSTAKAKR